MIYRILPFLNWFKDYKFIHFRHDVIAGITVALVLIPQSMAYAQLANLPAYFGLYAAFLPPMIASLFGSSRQLATGPVAMVSLMTAAALEPIATAGSAGYVAYAILLALMVGVFQFLLGAFRLGLVINFISHPVVNGFTNAGALIIATSQLPNLLGVSIEKAEHHYETVFRAIMAATDFTHLPTLLLAALAFTIMLVLKRINPKIPNVLVAVVVTTLISWLIKFENSFETDISRIRSPEVSEAVLALNSSMEEYDQQQQERLELTDTIMEAEEKYETYSKEVLELRYQESLITLHMDQLKQQATDLRVSLKAYQLRAVTVSDGYMEFYFEDELPGNVEIDKNIWRLSVGNNRLNTEKLKIAGGGKVVGNIPRGLPEIGIPGLDFNIIMRLLPMVIIISLIGFMEASAVAKAMAAKTGQRLDPNQELIGQGLANILGSFGKSYPVSGSFSRSAVNIQAGAITGMSGLFTSCMVIIALLFLTPLMYHLPQSVLAAIIMNAVLGLLNVKGLIHSWRAKKFDGMVTIITFVGTLGFAPHLERGILIGVVISLVEALYLHMRPGIAILSRHWDGSFRESCRWSLQRCKHILVIRYFGSLFFANASYLEDKILQEVSEMPDIRHVLIVGNGINEIDATGEEALSILITRLKESGYGVSISGLHSQILDTLKRTHLYDKIGEENMYRSVQRAVKSIHKKAHKDSPEKVCPLLKPVMSDEPDLSQTGK